MTLSKLYVVSMKYRWQNLITPNTDLMNERVPSHWTAVSACCSRQHSNVYSILLNVTEVNKSMKVRLPILILALCIYNSLIKNILSRVSSMIPSIPGMLQPQTNQYCTDFRGNMTQYSPKYRLTIQCYRLCKYYCSSFIFHWIIYLPWRKCCAMF